MVSNKGLRKIPQIASHRKLNQKNLSKNMKIMKKILENKDIHQCNHYHHNQTTEKRKKIMKLN